MKNFLILAVFALAFFQLSQAEELEPSSNHQYVASYMARFFPRQHLNQMPLNDQVSERIWNIYLNSLDNERLFFLQSDIDSFGKYIHVFDELINKGDISPAFHIYSVYKDRVADRCAFVEELLERGFDLTKKEDYVWRRKDAPWPVDEDDWNDIWRKRVKNEYLRHKISEILREEVAAGKSIPEPATNSTETAASPPPPIVTPPPPRESISKRYKQLSDLVKDSDSDAVVQKFLTAFANAYDPHSSYLPPAAAEDFHIEMKLSLVGIGAVLQAEDGTAKVMSLIPGGPASQDTREIKLAVGDKIIAVGQNSEPLVDILHWPLSKSVQKIRGKKGSKVVLLVIPASDPAGSTTKIVDLIRDEVKLEEQAVKWKLHEVKDAENAPRRLAVISIPAFYANLRAKADDPDYISSADDVAKALKEISTNNIDGILLDLRNNGGGSLIDAVRMTGLFIHEGPTVQVRESDNFRRVIYDEDPEIAYAGPLVVLVNRLSASASEILAAALSDYGRAIVVGDSRTHGKGTVQTVVNVGRNPELGEIKITTAVFYRITGDSTQLRGVVPDIHLPSPLDYMEIGEDSLRYPIEWNKIRPSNFMPYDDLSGIIEKCRELSVLRRDKSQEFKAYEKMLEQMERIYRAETVPLDLESRLQMSRAEREMMEHQREILEETAFAEDESSEKNRKDLILQKGLNILADFVSLKSKELEERVEHAKNEKPAGLLDKVMGWFIDK